MGAMSIAPMSRAATPSPKPPVFTSSASSGLKPAACSNSIASAWLVERGLRLYRPHELGNRVHVVADDLEVGALDDGDRGDAGICLAVRNTPREHIADRRAAALRGDDAGDIAATGLEEALVEGNRKRHAVRRHREIPHGDILGA